MVGATDVQGYRDKADDAQRDIEPVGNLAGAKAALVDAAHSLTYLGADALRKTKNAHQAAPPAAVPLWA